MKKNTARKISLSRDTLRELEAKQIVGGDDDPQRTATCLTCMTCGIIQHD